MKQPIFHIPEATDIAAYYEGVAARPFHITAGLPVQRKRWKQEILNSFEQSDVTVIRASSGQGKSTLAWQIAYDLAKRGWSPYELMWCEDEKVIGNIVTWLESRQIVGERPVIIVDGLRPGVIAWSALASRTRNLSIKFIVTTREENWYRFGMERSKLRLKPISIDMSPSEAEEIFNQFKQANKLHPGFKYWQPAWERVKDRGLLIEYVYLLTRGEMLEDRLSNQIKVLQEDKDAKAKTEILRLISVADLCGVRLPTLFLIESVEERIGFSGDRGELLKSLQKEYYIQFEDRKYVEGLHPVRSKHLVDILQGALPLSDTLVNLLPLIDAGNTYEFCASAPLLVNGKQRIKLLKKMAGYFSTRSYLEMGSVIDGLFSTDAYQNWSDNKEIYNELFSVGAGIFAMDAFPWSNINMLKSLAETMGDKQRGIIEKRVALLEKIDPFDPEKSHTLVFIETLSNALREFGVAEGIRGLGKLALWFHRFKKDCPPLLHLDGPRIWEAFLRLDEGEAGQLFNACYTVIPDIYRTVIGARKQELIGYLKRKTNTLTIKERGPDLLIEYVLEDSEQSVNDQSVSRITTIKTFLPQYERYCTQGLRLPLPGLEEFQKYDQLPAENVQDFFIINLNRIWMSRIAVMYESQSVYEWQKQWYDIREKSLVLAKDCIVFLEAVLGGKNRRSSESKINKLRPEVVGLLTEDKEFPGRLDRTERPLDISIFNNEIQEVKKWANPWRNFLYQLTSFLSTEEENPGRLANINMQEVKQRVGEMQDAFDFIADKTFPYFDTAKLKKDETDTYIRLEKTTRFFCSNTSQIGGIINPRITVAQWYASQEANRLESIHAAMRELEKLTGWSALVPSYTVETGALRRTTIGVRGLRWTELLANQTLYVLLVGLCKLADLDIDQYVIVTIENNHAEKPFGMSVYKDFLFDLRDSMIIGKEFKPPDFGNPMPINLDEELLSPLLGIMMPQIRENVNVTAISNILSFLWRLSVTRERLSKDSSIEQIWLEELEKDYKTQLSKHLCNLEGSELFDKYQEIVEGVAKGKPLPTEQLHRLVAEDLYE